MIRSLAFAVSITLAGLSTGAGVAQDLQLPEPVGMDNNPAARIVLAGNAAFLRGDLHTAAKDYRAALVRIPDFAVASFNLGLVEAHEGQSTQGLADMDRGIALATRHAMGPAFIARLRALRHAFTAPPVAT